MGTPKEPLKPRQPDVMFYDKNPHKVKLTQGFWLLETEVTQEMWQSVMGTNPSKFKGNRKPVEQVSWNDCQAFCQKLSEKLGQQVQLPSEAQWEYACRAGSTGSYAGDLDSMAWYYDNSSSTTHAVGKKQSNAWGLYDMHGNVSEWCFDAYDPRYYDDAPTYDPVNTNNDEGWGRVVRGGSWNFDERFCRSTDRHHERPDCQESKFIGRPNSIGLRLAIVPSQEE